MEKCPSILFVRGFLWPHIQLALLLCCYRVNRRLVCRKVQTFSMQLEAGGGVTVYRVESLGDTLSYQGRMSLGQCEAFDVVAPPSLSLPPDDQVAEREVFGTQHMSQKACNTCKTRAPHRL